MPHENPLPLLSLPIANVDELKRCFSYARQLEKKGRMKLVYVMMQEEYATVLYLLHTSYIFS